MMNVFDLVASIFPVAVVSALRRPASILVLLACSSVVFSTSTASAADWVDLTAGGSLVADVAQPDSRRTLLRSHDGIVISLESSAIRRHLKQSELTKYKAARETAGTDTTLNQALAKWCRTRGNLPMLTKSYRDYHLRRVVHAEPNDSATWAVLGYKQQGDRFVPVEDLMRDRGLVRTRGGWDMPEVVMRDRQNDADEVVAKTWVRDIARLVKTIQRGSGRVDESVAELNAIDDPLATLGIAESYSRLGRSTAAVSLRPLRRLLLDKLIGFNNALAIRTLVRAGLDDPDRILREVALEALSKSPMGRSSAVATYLPMLGSKNNAEINQAAAALSMFPDPELDLAYTDALVTTHKQTIAPGAGINTTFGGGGPGNSGGGLSTGGKAKVIERVRQNPAVLSLLRTIAPNVNFGYDEIAWRNYFVSLRTFSPGDLRADPPM